MRLRPKSALITDISEIIDFGEAEICRGMAGGAQGGLGTDRHAHIIRNLDKPGVLATEGWEDQLIRAGGRADPR
jgi:hypothetical protein